MLLLDATAGRCGVLPFPVAGPVPVLLTGGRRWCADGTGKLSFLSIAWTKRSKRWKSDSARVRIGMRSIVLESSLTEGISICNVRVLWRGDVTYYISALHRNA